MKALVTYNRRRIADELLDTAQGLSFYGNALRVAKDLPELDDFDRSVLDAYANGSQEKGELGRMRLQDIAIKICKAAKEQKE